MKTKDKTKEAVARLRTLTSPELKEEYLRVFHRCDSRLGDTFVRRRLAHYLQSVAYGEYEPSEIGVFERIAAKDPKVHPGTTPNRRTMLPLRGVTYVREYKGKLYEAKAAGYNQFEMDGKLYPSLTACVLAITGQHFSGRKWFRLKGAL